jgi:hypothetical protein
MGATDVRPHAGALAHWLDDHGHTQVWLARKLGISVASASRITRGASMPRPLLARKIETLTDGHVTVSALLHAKLTPSPANRAARKRYANELIARGTSILNAIDETP